MKQNLYYITRRALRRAALAAALALAALPASAGPAYDFKVDGLCYDINKDGRSVTVTYEQYMSYDDPTYPNANGQLTIPSSVTFAGKSYSVTAIGDNAFHKCDGFVGTLSIPNSVTSIGDNAFSCCGGFTGTLTIPNSVTSIDDHAFYYCSGFTGTLTIPNSVTTIGAWAFARCSGLTGKLIIPKSVTKIGADAFLECENITDVSLLNDLVDLDYGTFNDTGWYRNQPDGYVYLDKVLYRYKGEVERGSSIKIKEGTKTIAGGAFSVSETSNFSGSLYIPNSVVKIGKLAFEFCFNLSGNLIIPNSVKEIGDYAFLHCRSFTGSLNIPNSVEIIGKSAFFCCTGFNGSLSISNSVKTIGERAFGFCKGLTGSITIPYSVTEIGRHAFYKCDGFDGSLNIPESLTQIGDSAFYGCERLQSINNRIAHPANVTLGKNVFEGIDKFACTLCVGKGCSEEYAMAEQWREFSNIFEPNWYDFKADGLCYKINDDGLSVTVTYEQFGSEYDSTYPYASGQLTIPASVTYGGKSYAVTAIGDLAFDNCEGFVGTLTIPNSVTTIGRTAFYNCTGLSGNLIIPYSVTSIDMHAFSYCINITDIFLQNDLTVIGHRAFYGTGWYNFQPDGCVYLGRVLCCYKGDVAPGSTIAIKDGTIAIAGGAFTIYGCSNFAGSLHIPNSVIKIGDMAFADCFGLTGSLTIPNSVKEIGESAFSFCGFNGSLNISNSVEKIGDWVFAGCDFTGSLTIPSSVREIGDRAFYGCDFNGTLTLSNSLTKIGKFSFAGCDFSGSLTIPSSVTRIGNQAFWHCSGFSSLNIPESLTDIDYGAFADCVGLKTIKSRIAHPANVALGENVFDGIDKNDCTLYVGNGCRDEYARAEQWQDFNNIIETSWDVRGDLDGNGIVEIDDVNLVANVVLRKASLADWPAADLDGNGIVDIDDLNNVVNVILKKPQGGVSTHTVNGVSFKMIAVAGGTFTMGATTEQGDDAYYWEKPAHQVTLSSYEIGVTEVTQALWVAVMGSNPSYFQSSTNSNYGTNLQRPVESVSWYDCQEFISKLNELTGKTFRLPTEAEWEYAARGGNKSRGYKYSGSNTVDDVAWYWNSIPSHITGTAGYGTQTVATKASNELGIYDMSGNVCEWCQDRYGDYSSTSQTNPTGPASGHYRVYRGSDWNDFARLCRVSYRDKGGSPSLSDNCMGLRLCLSE